MFNKILLVMREKIRTLEYIMTLHAEEEMDADGFTIFDIENCILTGSIIEKQKDIISGENKYLISGSSIKNIKMTVAAKICLAGKLVLITVFKE